MSNKAIRYYALREGVNDVSIPDAPFEIIGVGVDAGYPCVWLEVDTGVEEQTTARFRMIPTGTAFTRDRNFSRFIGTIPPGFVHCVMHVLYEEL